MEVVARADGGGKPSASWRARAAAVTCSAALAGAALVVAGNDPAAASSHYPACLFHAATGLWCPGCGLTRGVHALLNGHVGRSLSANVFTPLVVLAVVVLMICWLMTAWGHRRLRLPREVQHRLLVVGTAGAVVFGVLRNVPVAPFRSLAP